MCYTWINNTKLFFSSSINKIERILFNYPQVGNLFDVGVCWSLCVLGAVLPRLLQHQPLPHPASLLRQLGGLARVGHGQRFIEMLPYWLWKYCLWLNCPTSSTTTPTPTPPSFPSTTVGRTCPCQTWIHTLPTRYKSFSYYGRIVYRDSCNNMLSDIS